MRQFLGMVNLYCRHTPDLATVARPLTALTSNDKDTGSIVKFVWNNQCESAFQKVKEMLVSAPLLHPPDLSKPFSYGQVQVEKALVPFWNKKVRQ